MRYISLFSGGGLMDCGLARAGWECVYLCEKDPAARRVLAKHHPGVECYDDVTTLDAAALPAVTALCGGTPCQGLSVAGKRGGLADPRSGLFRHFVRIADAVAPRWLLWENVVGSLSCSGGRDFATVLGGITGHTPARPQDGWRNAGICVGPKRAAVWCVRDALAVGGCAVHGDWRGRGPVPQRRRRVFIVAVAGDCRGLDAASSWRLHCRLAALPLRALFGQEGLLWHIEEGSKAEQGAAAPAAGGAGGGGGAGPAEGADEGSLCGRRGPGPDEAAAGQVIVERTFVEVGEGHPTYARSEASASLRAASGGGTLTANLVVEVAPFDPRNVTSAANRTRCRVGEGSPTLHAQGMSVVEISRPAAEGGGASGERSEAAALTAHPSGSRYDFDTETLVVEPAPIAFNRHSEASVASDFVPTLDSGKGTTNVNVMAFAQNQRGELREADHVANITAGGGKPGEGYPAVRQGLMVRRLSTTECQRLMGLPDDYLDLDPPLSNAAKYRICGLGVAANVARWLAERIRDVHEEDTR